MEYSTKAQVKNKITDLVLNLQDPEDTVKIEDLELWNSRPFTGKTLKSVLSFIDRAKQDSKVSFCGQVHIIID